MVLYYFSTDFVLQMTDVVIEVQYTIYLFLFYFIFVLQVSFLSITDYTFSIKKQKAAKKFAPAWNKIRLNHLILPPEALSRI